MESIKEYIKNNVDKNIIYKKKLPIIGIIIAVVGVVCLVTGLFLQNNLIAIIIGVAIMVTGIIIILCNKALVIHEQSGKVLKRYSFNIDSDTALRIERSTTNISLAQVKDIKRIETSDNMIEVWTTNKGEYLLYQMWRFIPYNYETSSPVRILSGEAAEYLANLAKNK